MNQARQLARAYLPDPVRKPLGSAASLCFNHLVRPLLGLWFDLCGGTFRADGCEFHVPKDITSLGFRACFVLDDYEPEERALIKKFLRADDTVLELGACLGIVSCVTNRLLKDRTRHVVVEGNPFCIPTIHRNRQRNSCGFLVENAAVSNDPEVTFYLHPKYVVGGTTQRKSDLPVRVPARSLAELDSRRGPFTALIMDIEGSELEIFAASAAQLKNYRLVIVELHPWAIGEDGVERCRQLLAAAGLKFQERAGITEAWQRG